MTLFIILTWVVTGIGALVTSFNLGRIYAYRSMRRKDSGLNFDTPEPQHKDT